MSIFARIDAAIGRVYRIVGNLVGVSIGIFALAIALDLLLRGLELGTLPGMQMVIEYALYAGVFLAAPWLLRLNGHIRVDLVLTTLPPRTTLFIERAIDAVAAIACLALVRYGMVNLLAAYASGSVQQKYYVVKEWFLLLFFVLCFALLAVEFVSRLIRSGPPPEAAEREAGEGF